VLRPFVPAHRQRHAIHFSRCGATLVSQPGKSTNRGCRVEDGGVDVPREAALTEAGLRERERRAPRNDIAPARNEPGGQIGRRSQAYLPLVSTLYFSSSFIFLMAGSRLASPVVWVVVAGGLSFGWDDCPGGVVAGRVAVVLGGDVV
jgi:hypothetical protein